MVTVSNICEVAFRCYSLFFTEMYKTGSTDIKKRVYRHLKKHITGDLRFLWLSNNA